MTKKEFIEKYEIANARPIDPSKRSIPAEGFSSAIAEFLEHRFHGAVNMEISSISAQSILISAEYVAYFFKELITEVYGRVVLDITIRSDDKSLIILVSSDEPMPIGEIPLRRLIKTARNAGFEINLKENTIMLTVAFSPISIRRIYAVSVVDSRRIMLGKMVEIFCHGDLLNPDEK